MWYVVLFKGTYSVQNWRPTKLSVAVIEQAGTGYYGRDIAEYVAEALQKAYDLHCERMREAEFTPIILN